MHHGSGPQNVQHQLQRSRSFTGSEEEQPAHPNLPPSPAAPFAPSASPSAPQSPGYQIQQLMSRSPVAGQNVNITLQNVGPVVGGNQQITLAPLPLPNPTSPGFQFGAQQRRFEHGSPSYIQVTSPMSQQVQTQSPTQPSPGPGQTLQNVRAGAPGPGLGICSSSPTGGFVDASVLVRQISLSPSSGGHFVFQEAPGLTQMAQGAQVQLQHSGAPITVRERRLSQPHAQSGGTIHHLGPQSPAAAGGTGLQPLASPNHITTASLPPQISVAIGQPQKTAGQTVVAQPVNVQQLLKYKQQTAVQQQKAIQPQVAQGQAAVQQKLTTQQITTQGPQQKVAYAAQPALKTQFLTTPISQAQKLAGTQQVQTQIQVAKLPQVVQQQTPVASIQQVASASQQASPQTVTLTQATAAGQQVQMIPTVTATAQLVQQKLIQQQVVTTASASLQTPGGPSPAQLPASSDSPSQQPKLQMRVPAVRLKTPTKPPCQ